MNINKLFVSVALIILLSQFAFALSINIPTRTNSGSTFTNNTYNNITIYNTTGGNISGGGSANQKAYWINETTIGGLTGDYLTLLKRTTYNSIDLDMGWNGFALTSNITTYGNFVINLTQGYNLIGYSGDRPYKINEILFNINNQQCYYPCNGNILIQDTNDLSNNGYNITNGVITRGSAFWINVLSGSGNMTFSNIGGMPIGQTYLWKDLMFKNVSGTILNITDASSTGWILSSIQQYDTSEEVFASSGNSLRPWKGYLIYSNQSNIKLLYKPTETYLYDLIVLTNITAQNYCNSTGTCKDLSQWGGSSTSFNNTNLAYVNNTNTFTALQYINSTLRITNGTIARSYLDIQVKTDGAYTSNTAIYIMPTKSGGDSPRLYWGNSTNTFYSFDFAGVINAVNIPLVWKQVAGTSNYYCKGATCSVLGNEANDIVLVTGNNGAISNMFGGSAGTQTTPFKIKGYMNDTTTGSTDRCNNILDTNTGVAGLTNTNQTCGRVAGSNVWTVDARGNAHFNGNITASGYRNSTGSLGLSGTFYYSNRTGGNCTQIFSQGLLMSAVGCN